MLIRLYTYIHNPGGFSEFSESDKLKYCKITNFIIQILRILIFENFRERTKNISIWIFKIMDFFLRGGWVETHKILTEMRASCRACQDNFRLIFYLECARRKFLGCALPCAHTTITEIVHFFTLGTFSKNNTAKSPRAEHWWDAPKIFAKINRGT